jgi:hypothetical protein
VPVRRRVEDHQSGQHGQYENGSFAADSAADSTGSGRGTKDSLFCREKFYKLL